MALDNFKKTSMRIDKANQRFLDYQNAKVGDVNGRELLVQITNNGVVEDQTGTSLKLNWQHENGKQGYTNFKTVDIKTGKYSLYYPKEMLYKGTVDASVEINSNGQTTNTMNFKIIVHADVFNGEAGTVNGAFISLADVNKKLDDREKEYVDLKDRQTSVETQFNSIQQEMTDKDVISAPELIAARNGKSNLKTRLDEEHAQVTAQLAQTTDLTKNMLHAPITTKKVYLTLTDDDAKKEVWTKLKPVAEEFGVPITLAVPVRNELSTPERELTREQILTLQNELGWEMTSHSWTHSPQMRTFSDEQLEYELRDSKRELESWGLEIKNFIAPFGVNDTLSVRRIASKYYNCTPSAGGTVNYKPVQNHMLQRLPFGSFTTQTGYDYFKTQLDNAIRNGGWLILMMHCAETSHDATQTENLRQLIQYAQSQGVEIVNLQEGFEAFGNMVEVEGVASLDRMGKFHGEQGHDYVVNASKITIDTPPNWFRYNYPYSRVVSYFTNVQAQPFPGSSIGTLITKVYGGADDAQQEWLPYKSATTYKRYSADATGNTWTDWQSADKVLFTGNDTHTSASPITDFARTKISYTYISPNNTNGFPFSGLLETNNLANTNGYIYQKISRPNEPRQMIFQRTWMSSNTWSAWKLISQGASMGTAGRISANYWQSGDSVFDTDLGKPLWYRGSNAWVDATGATV